MKKEGLSIKTELFNLEIDGVEYLSIKLMPPHDRRIIFPMDYQLIEKARATLPLGEVFLLPRVKNGLLCKVECYSSISEFHYQYEFLKFLNSVE